MKKYILIGICMFIVFNILFLCTIIGLVLENRIDGFSAFIALGAVFAVETVFLVIPYTIILSCLDDKDKYKEIETEVRDYITSRPDFDEKRQSVEEAIKRLENLFNSYKKDSEFNYQLNVNDSPFNIIKNYFSEVESRVGCPLEVLIHLIEYKPFYYEDENGELHKIQSYDLGEKSITFDDNWQDHDMEIGDFGGIQIDLGQYKECFFLKEDRSE